MENNILRITVYGLLILLLTSCANNSAITKETLQSVDYEPDRNKAIITGSVTIVGGGWGAWVTLKNKNTGAKQLISAQHRKDDYAWRSSSGSGRTYLLELLPGEYEIIDWEYSTPVIGGDKIFKPIDMQPITINLEAGERVYLGNINFEVIYGKNIIGMNMPADLNVQVFDKRKRDLNNLKRKFPKLEIKVINNQILKYKN